MSDREPAWVQEYNDGNGIYEFRSFFGEKITLEEIIAPRVLRDMAQEAQSLDNQEKTT